MHIVYHKTDRYGARCIFRIFRGMNTDRNTLAIDHGVVAIPMLFQFETNLPIEFNRGINVFYHYRDI